MCKLSRLPSLVSTNWLKKQLGSQATRQVKVLDTSWGAMQGGHNDYARQHIPGALFFDLNKCVHPTPLIPRNPPDLECFVNYAQQLGINNDSDLVLYDRGTMLAACRAWWTFRSYGHNHVSVVNGGLAKWVAEGMDTISSAEEEAVTPQRGDFKATPRENLMKSYEQMVEVIESKSSQIVDVRRANDYAGNTREPTASTENAMKGTNQPIPTDMKSGHIPGSINMPFANIIERMSEKYILLKSNKELEEEFQKAGVDVDKSMTTLCYAGNAATIVALAAAQLGNEDVGVYYGSWTEWSQRSEIWQTTSVPAG